MLKIIVTGPESSGKTTLCKEISNQFNIPFTTEYAREYLEKKGVNYNQSELNNANNECPIGFWKGSNDKCYPTCNSPSQSRDIQGRCICNGSNEHHKKCTSDSKCLKNNDTYVCQPNEIRFN